MEYKTITRPDGSEQKLAVYDGKCRFWMEGIYDSLPENRAWIAPERARELGVEDGDAVRMERADGKGGEIRVRVIPGMHPDAVFMLHGFGHRLPVESRARGKGLADQEFMHGGLDKEDAMVHGLALQEHFVTLRPVRNDHAREEN